MLQGVYPVPAPATLQLLTAKLVLTMRFALFAETTLAFLGLGDPRYITWGYMIGASRTVIRTAWWMSVFPGVAIMLTVLAINLIGEGLNDALNPRLARKGRA